MSIWLILSAIIPGLLISYYIFHIDRFDREPVLQLVICFILGITITFPALWLQEYFDSLGFDEYGTLWQTFVFALIGVALVEEGGKLFCLMIYPFHRPFFNEPLDGIVYSVVIGMGFATFENILYAQNYGIDTILVRAFTAIPAHGAFAVIVGYFVGLAKFEKGFSRKIWLILQGLFFAILLHGVYDFFLLQQVYDGLMGMALLTLSLGIYVSRRLIFIHLVDSEEAKMAEQACNVESREREDTENL